MIWTLLWDGLALFGLGTLAVMWWEFKAPRLRLKWVEEAEGSFLAHVLDWRGRVRSVVIAGPEDTFYCVCYWADTGLTLDDNERTRVLSLFGDHKRRREIETRKAAAEALQERVTTQALSA